MLRLAVFLIVIAAAAAGLAWLADRPGEMLINWEGYEVRTSVFHAIVAFAIILAVAILLWSILRGIWQSPAAIGNFFNRRRETRGLEALSSGMIAIGAGDKSLATTVCNPGAQIAAERADDASVAGAGGAAFG